MAREVNISPIDVMLSATKDYADEYNLSQKDRLRWATMLVLRAVQFYIDGQLDSEVAEEDLYLEDRKLPNLEYSEQEFSKWFKRNFKE